MGNRCAEANRELDTSAPEARSASTAYIDAVSTKKLTKKDIWERSLLDLSLRNNLLNMRFGAKLMPLATASLDDLEDTMADRKSLSVLPKPAEWGRIELAFERLASIEELRDFLR